MTLQYDQKTINQSPETSFKSYIFDPNATQSDTSFSDWDALLAILQSLPGIKQILIPNAPPLIQIPAGVYDMTDIVISGETPLAAIGIDDVQFQNLSEISNLSVSVGATVPNTVPSFVFDDGANHVLSCEEVTFVVGGFAAEPIFDISTGTSLGINAFHSAFLSANPAVPVFAVDATSTLIAPAFAGVQGNSWGGALGSDPFVVVALGGAFTLNLTTGDIFWSVDNPAGPTVVNRADDYEEAVLADWNGVAPLNVKTALDRIAAFIGPVL